MATEAQIEANRMNAQKSTGPRTAEGKETVSQNALKHGLLAREGAIRGEYPEEFDNHREGLLRQLRPESPLEGILAERVVDLSWRLQRAAQSQAEAFAALYEKYTQGAPVPEDPDERRATLGRMIVADFCEGAVLDRLLRYERRIEGGFYRALREMRYVFDQRQKAAEEIRETLARWKEEDWEAKKARNFAPIQPAQIAPRPDSGTTNTPGPEAARDTETSSLAGRVEGVPPSERGQDARDTTPADESCQTNPMPEPAVRSVLVRAYPGPDSPSAALSGQALPVRVADSHGQDARATHGRDAHATRTPDGVTTNLPADESCQTNPMSGRPGAEPVGSTPGKALGARVEGVPPSERGQDARDTTPTDESCETNPIWLDAKEGQVLDEKGVTSNSVPNGLERTNPILAEDGACQCLVEPVGAGEALVAGPAT